MSCRAHLDLMMNFFPGAIGRLIFDGSTIGEDSLPPSAAAVSTNRAKIYKRWAYCDGADASEVNGDQ
jgi:hypothetical protein